MFFACLAPAVLLGLYSVPTAPETTFHSFQHRPSVASESSAGSHHATPSSSAATASAIINNIRSNAWSVTKSIQRYQRALSLNLKFRLQLTEHFSITNMGHPQAEAEEKLDEFSNEIERKNSLNTEMGGRFVTMSLENG
jgi:hypothetical protein